MCDIVETNKLIDSYDDPDGIIFPGQTEAYMKIDKEDEIIFNQKFISDRGSKIYCRHPGTDWHLMEVGPNQSLRCPAETELKLVLPEPYIEGDL